MKNNVLDLLALLFGIRTENNSEGRWPSPMHRVKPFFSAFKTLALLLAGITVLFFLISVLTATYFKEQNTERKLNSLSALITKYHHSHSQLPVNLAEVVMNDPTKRDLTVDSWGSPILYKTNLAKQTFVLYSGGKDRKLNTDDDVAQVVQIQNDQLK